MERQVTEQLKAEKLLVKAATRNATIALINDPAKQPIKQPHKKAQHYSHVHCGGVNTCRAIRVEVAHGMDDGWTGCPVDDCNSWFCHRVNCQKQAKTHIERCLFIKEYVRLKPY